MLNAGNRAPEFGLAALDGKRFVLDDKLTLAIFFKTSCPTCQYAWPFYERLYRAYNKNGLQVWGISQHDPERTLAFEEKYGATFPHLIDESWQVSRQYDPEFVPTAFLIGKGQEILETTVSWNRDELSRLGRAIAAQLQVPEQQLIKPGEDVVVFKPG